jgi:hypothetical protein
LERAQVALGRQIEHVGELLNAPLHRALDAPTKTKAFHQRLLNVRVLKQLGNPRVLKHLEKAVFELSHVCESRLADDGLELRGERRIAFSTPRSIKRRLSRVNEVLASGIVDSPHGVAAGR